MKKFNYIKTLSILACCAFVLTTSNICTETADAVSAVPSQTTAASAQIIQVKPLTVVASPKAYLNKKIEMNAKFDKFSTVGLDYKPAMRSSEKYISFLIKRDDTGFDIPLSEMKLFLTREKAEKLLDLKSNDEILIKGTVFSDALGDAWIDVEGLTVTKKAPEKGGVKS